MNALGMNTNSKNNSVLMNSLIAPLNMVNNAAKNTFSVANTAMNSVANNLGFNSGNSGNSFNTGSGFEWTGLIMILVFIAIFATIYIMFQSQIEEIWKNVKEIVSGFFEPTYSPTPPANDNGNGKETPIEVIDKDISKAVESVLPSGGNEVFNVSSNRYTYYDAQPLCKAFGAELATYEQVKESWAKGADWCNYGWVEGQMAVYPTSEETYKKLQDGPEEQRLACGRPGVNGGYFDNPEMRFGVNCYGKKPSKSAHDAEDISKGAPVSPDALAFDKKVNEYKTEADTIGINPFNSHTWN